MHQWYSEGECIDESYTNTNRQRIAEIDILANTLSELKIAIERIQENIDVKDVNGIDMLYKPFDVERIISQI